MAGEKVKKGDTIADGPATKNGEMALGRNVLVAFSTWEGYNYEDAILLNLFNLCVFVVPLLYLTVIASPVTF